MQGWRNHPPPSENCIFSTNEHQADSRPVCKLKFVHHGPVEKQSALSALIQSWQPDKVREHLFPNSEIEIYDNFYGFSSNFPNFQKKSQGMRLKARGLNFGI